METLSTPTTTPTWVDEEKDARIVGSTIKKESITLTIKKVESITWSLVITIANNSTHYTLEAQSLEKAKGKAVSKLKEIVDTIVTDASEIILSNSTEVLGI